MKYGLATISMLIAGLFVVAVVTTDAQVSRDRYVVVRARELAETPQRYWSRGVVFEDVLEDVSGRGRRAGGRSFGQIETEVIGRCYVDDAIMDQVQGLRKGRRYLFAGTVLSETRRGFLFIRPSVRYFVAIDSVERLSDDVDADLLEAFIDQDPDRPAFRNIQKALTRAQNELVAFAQGEEVDIGTLFEPRAETMDKAAEVSRVAVREIERELGITSTEMLGLLVRELLVAQYLEGEPPAVPPREEPKEIEEESRRKPEPEPPPAQTAEPKPAEDVQEMRETEAPEEVQEDTEEEDGESAPPRRGWFRRGAEPESEELEIEEVPEVEEEVIEDSAEEEPSARRGFFRRRTVDETEELQEEVAEVVEEEEVEEEVPSPRRSRRLFGRADKVEEELAEPEEEMTDQEEEVVPEPEPVRRTRLREAAQPAPAETETPLTEEFAIRLPVRRY